ncbi:MAG: DUF6799 domain-containing protein [Verrucomicrobiota bacterium]
MKTFWLSMLSVCALALSTVAQDTPAKDEGPQPSKATSVTVQGGKVIANEEGKAVELEKDIIFADSILVTTNATFKLKQGKERKLKEGETLNKDFTLTAPDGSITPVEDHIAVKGGQIVVVRDGESSVATQPVTLQDGTVVQPDGIIVRKGQPSRLIDGQLLKLSGSVIPATDTATLKDGQVVVQKDGALLRVNPISSITMSDGTRVFGNGTVRKPDGTEVQLKEGELLRIEGVRTGLR